MPKVPLKLSEEFVINRKQIFKRNLNVFLGAWISAMSPCFVRILGLSLLSPAFGLLTGLRGITALLGQIISN